MLGVTLNISQDAQNNTILLQTGKTFISKSTDQFFDPFTLGTKMSGFLYCLYGSVAIDGVSFSDWGVAGDNNGDYGTAISLGACTASVTKSFFAGNYGNNWYRAI